VIEIGFGPPDSRAANTLKRSDFSVSKGQVEIYTKFGCGYCFRAKRLLDSKSVEYVEHDITMGGPKRAEMLERAPGARTVPQIFIGDSHVGGSDDLAALELAGTLDRMLADL
jgi:glutaredoxin 3